MNEDLIEILLEIVDRLPQIVSRNGYYEVDENEKIRHKIEALRSHMEGNK